MENDSEGFVEEENKDEETNNDDSDEYIGKGFRDGDYEHDKFFKENVYLDSEWSREGNKLEIVSNKVMVEDSTDGSLANSEDEFRKEVDGSDIEENAPRFPSFNFVEQFDPTFQLGMVFSTKLELRNAIHSHAIKNRRNINITRNDKTRVYAKCAADECQWKLHALKLTGECTYQIRKYVPEHSCGVNFRVKNLKSTWLSKKYLRIIRSYPKRNVKGFRIDIIEDIRCNVMKSQAYRAKAIELLEGRADEQYTPIWDFANELKRTNPGSTIVIGTDDSTGDNRFDRIYMCLYAVKVDFLSGCRPFIGVDECHLKGPHGGVAFDSRRS